MLDYVRFRVVCLCWRSATVFPRGRGIADPQFHPHSWTIMLRDDEIYFFNLSTGVLVCPRIPHVGHNVLCMVEGLLLLRGNTIMESLFVYSTLSPVILRIYHLSRLSK